MRFLIGVDLGQAHDPTALAVLEQIPQTQIVMRYDLRHLHRFPLGTLYPAIVAHTCGLLAAPPLAGASDLVADATGVGMPVVDLLRQAGLLPVAVTITGGHAATQEETHRWRVPKRDLMSTLQVLLQAGRLRIAEALPEAPPAGAAGGARPDHPGGARHLRRLARGGARRPSAGRGPGLLVRGARAAPLRSGLRHLLGLSRR